MRSLAAFVLAVALTAPVHAQEGGAPDDANIAEARERVARGEELFTQGDFDAALAEFERAYDLIGEHPSRYLILYNIGRAHERRFRYDLALRYYRRYLDEGGPAAPRREAVAGAIETLEGLLATVHVRVNVEHAEVWVEDRMVGTAPGDVLLPAGRHVLELRAEGHTSARRELQIAPQTEETLEITLSALAAELRGIEPAFFWIATASAVVAGLAGGAFGVAALLRRADIDAQNADPLLRIMVGEAQRGEIRTLAITADVLYGTAGLLAATALVFAFLTDWGGPRESAVTPSVAVSPHGLSADLAVRW